jgi:hypothetical protein
MKVVFGESAADHFHTSNLDNPVALRRLQTGGFSIEKNKS